MDHSLDNESRAGVPIAVVATTLTIATTAVCLRTYTRACMLHNFGMDDWSAVVALVKCYTSPMRPNLSTANTNPAACARQRPGGRCKYVRIGASLFGIKGLTRGQIPFTEQVTISGHLIPRQS